MGAWRTLLDVSQPETPSTVRVFVAALTVLAVGAVGWAVRSVVPEFGLESGLSLAAGSLAVWIVRVGMSLRRFRGERSEAYSYEEALFPLLLATIGPSLSVIAFALGTVVVYLRANKRGLKTAFNVSRFTLAAAGGAWAASLIRTDTDGSAMASVLIGAGTYALVRVTIFGTLMSLVGSESWSMAVMSELRETGEIVVVQVMLGVTGAVALRAVPASTPFVVLALAVALHMHARWYQLTRDREKIDDLLHVTVDLHGSLSTEEVERRLSSAIYTLISADAELLAGASDPPADGMAFAVDAGSMGTRTLVVRRDDPSSGQPARVVTGVDRLRAHRPRFGRSSR